MKHNKQLDQLVKFAYRQSLNGDNVDNSVASRAIKALSSLPTANAIYCLKLYQKLIAKFINQHTLTIESGSKLTTDEVKAITKTYQQFSIHQTQVETNPSLLAGLRIKIGDNVFEDSIQSRIQQLGVTVHG